MRHRSLILTLLAVAALCACTSEEDDGRNDVPSVCSPGGPCEQTLLDQCGCCAPEDVEKCRSTKSTLCATGNLLVGLSIAQCEETNRTFAAVPDGCALITPSQLAEICPQFRDQPDVVEPEDATDDADAPGETASGDE